MKIVEDRTESLCTEMTKTWNEEEEDPGGPEEIVPLLLGIRVGLGKAAHFHKPAQDVLSVPLPDVDVCAGVENPTRWSGLCWCNLFPLIAGIRSSPVVHFAKTVAVAR